MNAKDLLYYVILYKTVSTCESVKETISGFRNILEIQLLYALLFLWIFLKLQLEKNQWLHLTPSSAIFFDLRSFDFLILHCKPTADGNHLFFCCKLKRKRKKKTHLKWPLKWLYEGEDLAYPCWKKTTPKVICWPCLEALMRFHLHNLNGWPDQFRTRTEASHYIRGWRSRFLHFSCC